MVEVESLAKVFGGAERGQIALGSAKSNIGHLKAGAGAAGCSRRSLALHDKILPPTLNAERPNPNIDFPATPFYLNPRAREWERPAGTRAAPASAPMASAAPTSTWCWRSMCRACCTSGAAYTGAAANLAEPRTDDQDGDRRLTHSAASPRHRSQPAKPPLRGILALGARDAGRA